MFNGWGGVYLMAVGVAVSVGMLTVTTAQTSTSQTPSTQTVTSQTPSTQTVAPQAASTQTTPGSPPAGTPTTSGTPQTAGTPSPSPAVPGPIAPRPIGTMSELMIRLIYPTSDAVFYITTRAPSTEAEWGELQAKTLTLAESGNLLMMPGRARDQDRWMVDAKRMADAGAAAYRAARAKDLTALEDLNDQLYQSCVECHQHYRPGYGRRPAPDSNR
jgi:hypothetical protein